MKATGYQPSVGLKVGSTPARQAGGNSLVYGDGSGYGAMARGFGTALSLVEKEREEDMVADVTAAKNEYDKRISDLLYNEENGLMNKKLANARGIGKTFEEEEKKIRADILPMLPKYEKAHLAFANLADKDSQRNFNTVRNYSLEQKKAYRDVNLTNSINFKMENAQHYYKDPSAVKEQLDAIYTDIRANCESEYGAEWCKMKYEEYEAKTVVSVIETATANDDNESAKNLISAFGDKVPPSVLNRYRQGLLESDKQNMYVTESQRIAQEIGYDMTKVDAYVDNLDSYEVDTGGNYYMAKEYFAEMKGTPYLWGGNGKDGIDCSGFTQQAAEKMGVQIPRTADAQCHWAEENGKFVPNDGSYQPKAGDLVFITGTDSQFKPSDNWEESQNPDNMMAYKGVTHVGMVTENGTIMQAGSTNGVSEVPMSAFEGKILGYGQIGSGKQRVKYSATEKEKLKSKIRANIEQYNRDEQTRIDQTVSNLGDVLWDMYQSGNRNEADFLAVVNRHSADKDVYRQGLKLVDDYFGSSRSGSGAGDSSGGLSKDGMAVFKDNIDTGEYRNESDLRDDLQGLGVSPAQSRELILHYRKAQENSVEWDSQKKDFQRAFGKNEGLWLGAKAAVQDFIQDYVEKNGRQPSYSQIQDALAKAATKPETSMWASSSELADYEQMGISDATMRAMDISNARPNGDGTVTVTYPNGRTAKMDKEEFDTQVKRNS